MISSSEASKLLATPEYQASAANLLTAQFVRVQQISAELSVPNMKAEEWSQALVEDELTFEPITHQVAHSLRSATDHLELVREGIVNSNNMIRPFAHYTLMRSAIEMGSTAIWLMVGGRIDKRVKRSLTKSWSDLDDLESAMGSFGERDTAAIRKARARLRELADARPGVRGVDLGRNVTTSDVLRESDRSVKSALKGLDAWKICSAFAHGNQVMTIAASRLDVGAARRPRAIPVETTVDLPKFAAVYKTAVDHIDHAKQRAINRLQVRNPRHRPQSLDAPSG